METRLFHERQRAEARLRESLGESSEKSCETVGGKRSAGQCRCTIMPRRMMIKILFQVIRLGSLNKPPCKAPPSGR